MEWSYAFDIHCNASLPYILLTSVLQYFLLPFLLSTWTSDTGDGLSASCVPHAMAEPVCRLL